MVELGLTDAFHWQDIETEFAMNSWFLVTINMTCKQIQHLLNVNNNSVSF